MIMFDIVTNPTCVVIHREMRMCTIKVRSFFLNANTETSFPSYRTFILINAALEYRLKF